MFRLPVPIKLFISYVAVVAIGSVPTYALLDRQLDSGLRDVVTHDLMAQATAIAAAIGASDGSPAKVARRAAALTNRRVTIVGEGGRVIFDSKAAISKLDSHQARPEIAAVFDDDKRWDAFRAEAPSGQRVGVASRMSKTTQTKTIYVATKVRSASTGHIAVRVASPLSLVDDISAKFVSVIRNAQAVALSVAICFSLLAAVMFMRPLRRLRLVASATAHGDYSSELGHLGNDEVGDVGRALVDLNAQLRQRMTQASDGESVLNQIIDEAPFAMLAFDDDGFFALNSSCRRALDLVGTDAEVRFRDLVEGDERLARVFSRLPKGSQYRIVTFRHVHPTADFRCRRVERANGPPIFFLIAPAMVDGLAKIPPPSALRTFSFEEFAMELNAACDETGEGIRLSWTSHTDVGSVVDVDDRVLNAIVAVLKAADMPDEGSAIEVDVKPLDTSVQMTFDVGGAGNLQQQLAALLEPIGARLQLSDVESAFWVPRA